MTAAQLLRALAHLAPRVDGCDLLLAGPPPAPLRALVPVLQSGVRAALTGRPWHGIGDDGRGLGPLADGALDPARPLPWPIARVCVAGDSCWDVCRCWWRLDLPHLFGTPTKLRPVPAARARRCLLIPLSPSAA